MNAVMENILTRRSIRAFQNKEIPKNELEQIVQAGLYAPSGQNRQTWKFTVVTDRDKIRKLAEVIGRKLGRDGYDMYSPQVLVIPSNEKENRHSMEDNACALENIFLAAHSFGIGSVWINQMRDLCQESEVREILNSWDIPRSHKVFGMAALGYAAASENKEVKKTGEVHFVE
ncbi:nitroreductase family protein [Blautia pseudococcoides]|uniref:nitroreductase family protein n=1 Tax=Blautia pseudococcoides TaxID=1796616 RepID=UPI00148AEF52|nr:nitroreductase family protein [Blautia pseudococcoides]QJU14534.1 nitroreductase family protein [Blautia pseudococcoides]